MSTPSPHTSARAANRFERRRGLTLFFIFAVFLLLLEGALQVRASFKVPMRSIRPDIRTHHNYTPSSWFVNMPKRGDDYPPAMNRINRLGIRATEIGPKTVPRVLLLGDSFVQADQVRLEKTMQHRLGAMLGPDLEFIAHGIASWSPTPELSWLHHIGLGLRPDHVVLFLCPNDFYRAYTADDSDASYRLQAIYRDGIPVEYDLPIFSRSLWDELETTRQIRKGWKKLSGGGPDLKNIAAEVSWFAREPEAWPRDLRENVEETLSVVWRMQQLVEDHGARLHLAIVPFGWRWRDETRSAKGAFGWPANFVVAQSELESLVHEQAVEHAVPFIDLGSAFDAAKTADAALRLFNDADAHWNTAGHAVVADAVARHLREQGIAPRN